MFENFHQADAAPNSAAGSRQSEADVSYLAFLQHANDLGGPLRFSCEEHQVWLAFFINIWAKQWQQYAFTAANGEPFWCIMGYTADAKPNGACEKINQQHCISLTLGMSMQYQWLAAHVLSQPKILTELLTQPMACEIPIKTIILVPETLPTHPVNWLDDKGLARTSASRPARLHALLYHDLMQISLHHEIYHGLLGHLVADCMGLGGMGSQVYRHVEFAPISDAMPLSDLELVALEHQADHAAVGSICYRILIGDDSLRDHLVPDIPLLYRIGMLQIAAALVCLSWSIYQQQHRLIPTDHPATRVRYLGMQAAIRQILLQNNQRELFINASRWAYLQVAQLTNGGSIYSPLAALASPKIMAHVIQERQKILAVLDQLHHKLQPFTQDDR